MIIFLYFFNILFIYLFLLFCEYDLEIMKEIHTRRVTNSSVCLVTHSYLESEDSVRASRLRLIFCTNGSDKRVVIAQAQTLRPWVLPETPSKPACIRVTYSLSLRGVARVKTMCNFNKLFCPQIFKDFLFLIWFKKKKF